MAPQTAPDPETHLVAPLNLSKPPVESLLQNQSKMEASEVNSEKQGIQQASNFLLSHSLQVSKPSLIEEKQDSGVEKHEAKPLCVPEMQPLKFSVLTCSGADVAPIQQTPLSSQTSELHGFEISPAMEAPDMRIVKPTLITDSEALSTEHPPLMHNVLPESEAGISVALCNGHDTSSTEAVIDTDAPFDSVKGAVTLFEERVDSKPQSQVLEERRAAPGFDIHHAKEEIAHCRERIVSQDASVVDLLRELEKTKKQMRLCKGEVPVIRTGEGGLSTPNQPEEVSNVNVAKDVHLNVLHELESAQKDIEDVLEKRSLLELSKQSAFKDCKAAMSAQDDTSTRVKELTREYASRQESLAAAKASLAETEADITFLRSILSVKPEGKLGVEPTQISDSRISSLKIMELDVANSATSMLKLMEELATVRDVEVSNSEGEFLGAKVRLEQAKISEGNCVAALGRALEQLDEMKLNLKKAIDEGASLTPTVRALQAEVSHRQAELESAHETEQIACATLASLQDELCSVRAKVLSAQAGESKAREAKRSLPAAIKELALDADEAKAASNLAREEARKSRLEVEQAKSGTNTTLSRLQATQKEAEAARASEAIAVAEFTALSKSTGELGGEVAVTITFEEYCSLHDAGRDAEEAANKKVAAIFVQVDAATVDEKKAQEKLDITLKEMDVLLKALEDAQKKADDAQAAKLSVEAELRKWRAEHEQWRKTGSSPSSVSTSAAQSPRFLNGKSSQGKIGSHPFQGKAVTNLDTLAEVLTLKVPSSEKIAKVMPEMNLLKKAGKVKKTSFFARVMAIIVGKKSKSVR